MCLEFRIISNQQLGEHSRANGKHPNKQMVHTLRAHGATRQASHGEMSLCFLGSYSSSFVSGERKPTDCNHVTFKHLSKSNTYPFPLIKVYSCQSYFFLPVYFRLHVGCEAYVQH